ncbi:predicted protein, partial [Nematostella vectensis]
GDDSTSDPLVVQTLAGAVRGRLNPVVHGLQVRQFRAIPYAQPPVGKLRFAAPLPAKPWSGVRDATQHGPVCPQLPDEEFGKMLGLDLPPGKTIENSNEDCLTISVYTPQNSDPDKQRAVMVFIHGGGFTSGASRDYDPSVLVALNDVIVVTINYRLGVLGFFNIPDTEYKGNYGLLDQVLALQWVQQNIASFGGNPKSVTIFGESAGGMSVSLHLLSPLSKGLFHRVIAQSGSAVTDSFVGHYVKTTALLEVFSKAVGCPFDDKLVDCLRITSSEDVFAAQSNVSYPNNVGAQLLTTPVIDKHFLPDKARRLLGEGRVNKADVMLGVTANEGALLAMMTPGRIEGGLTLQELHQVIEYGLDTCPPDNTMCKEAIKFEYQDHRDPNNSVTNRQLYMDLYSDSMFIAPAIFEANALASAGHATFVYKFENLPDFFALPPYCASVHGIDIPYTFGFPLTLGESSPLFASLVRRHSEREKGLSMYMMKTWADFAKHGDPNHDGDAPVPWPRYNTTAQAHLVIAHEPRVEYKFRAEKVAFWNEFIPKLTKLVQTSDRSGGYYGKSQKDEF